MEEVRAVVASEPTAQPELPDPRAKQMNIALGYSVCYIVCGVVVEGDKVLMVQEAKPSCRGKWYLPAGRMEKNETIVEAVKREVKEESGLDFEPEGLIAVECHRHYWVRFTLGGRIVGGSLKTPAQADRESIQAQWQPADSAQLGKTVTLRALDCLRLIELGREWYGSGKMCLGVPALVGHVSCSLRLVVVHEEPPQQLQVLTLKERVGRSGLPSCLMGQEITQAIKGTIEGIGYTQKFVVVGVLHLEHLGTNKTFDGFCLSVLVQADSSDLVEGALCQWEEVMGEECVERLNKALHHHAGCAKLIDL